MVKFIEVTPDEIPNVRDGRRGRVSYPILKSFMESKLYVAKLDRTGMQQSLMGLTSCLTSYIRSHELPIRMFTRKGELYLMRLDLNEDGSFIENWKQLETTEGADGAERDVPPVPLDATEVASRFEQEKGQSTK